VKPKKQAAAEQQSHWNETFTNAAAFFGAGPSDFAMRALDIFRNAGVRSLLEMGCGQGRDTMLFARGGIEVTALDYSEAGVEATGNSAATAGLSSKVHSLTQDLRRPLPFADDSFDACYSHMLLCMELNMAQIAFVLRETHRVVKPGGRVVYSVRSNFDKHFGTGINLGGDLYGIGDFVIHFFTEEKIHRLSRGYEILSIERMEEGSLPRDLFCVTMKKAASPDHWDIGPSDASSEEVDMGDPLERFQAFKDATLAPGVLDHKTKQLVALGAALAAGCGP